MRHLRILGLAGLAITLLSAGCGGEPPEEIGAGDDASAAGELAQPPSADAPRATQPGFAPDTMRAETEADTSFQPAPTTSDLSVDSIVAQYRNHYAAGQVDVATEGGEGTSAEIEEEAKRRTALDFGYVEQTAWSDMVADLTQEQRAELSRRIGQATRELDQALQREGVPTEP